MTPHLPVNKPSSGFTLVEMAVVLVIVGLLLGGMLLPLSTQLDLEGNRKTTAELAEIKEALLGFAVINGRLPCPADNTTDGQEVGQTNGVCNTYQGFLPAATLGITPTDNQGYAIDYWGNNNSNHSSRIRYALSNDNSPIPNTTSAYRFNSQISLTLSPNDLKVCASSTGITKTACGTSSASLTSNSTVVAVIYSLGKNGYTGGKDKRYDENANLHEDDTNYVFVSHEVTDNTETSNEFDDQLVWISFPVLANRMITAGKLP